MSYKAQVRVMAPSSFCVTQKRVWNAATPYTYIVYLEEEVMRVSHSHISEEQAWQFAYESLSKRLIEAFER